ncbi:MAG: hypothetical protein AMXMBFR83_30420 [Phycisphaerae bacterium]
MPLSEVEHQPRAHRILQRALAGRRMPHAYVFAGPEGVGKELMAVGLAQTLLCPSQVRLDFTGQAGADLSGVDACGECQDCRLVKAGTHPDLYLIHRQLSRQHPEAEVRKRLATQLGVEVVRHFLIAQAGHRPARGRAKVFIVREAERMNDSAQNALLKTLEEPPPDTFLVLLSSGLDRLLPTTRSRCQQVVFQSLPVAFVERRLGELCPDRPAAERAFAARHSGGSLGQALRDLEDGLFALKRAWGQRLTELAGAGPDFAAHALAGPFEADARTLAKGVAERDPDVSETDAARAGLRTLLAVLAEFYADALRRVAGAALPPVNADQPEAVAALAGRFSRDALLGGLRAVAEAESHVARNANIQLAIETLFIRLRPAG